ncbi:hypothetical protein Pcinc_004303 [Petrolisthes cinctipes]|uniref:U-box domain-containing protein n=1 Tax=Petrolisthes cinctipes TaxID=88211 RepID=A0AAE1L184_PETCI|nr:hypothetical protein Pcinc_004303 [Petrolisthes cinctipes]
MGIKEAQCDTCHHTHSSAAVEATQALMEVNNTNDHQQLDHHQQQPDHPTEASIVINRVRQDFKIIYDVGQSTTRNYWSVLCSLMALFKTPLSFPDYIQCFKIAWRFVDGVTQLMMESPVLLQTSQMTVDETALVYLLLQKSPRCPFTRTTLDQHSFCRLPELQLEIHAWRTNVSTTSHHHNNP